MTDAPRREELSPTCPHGRIGWPHRTDSGGWTCADCVEEHEQEHRRQRDSLLAALEGLVERVLCGEYRMIEPEDLAALDAARAAIARACGEPVKTGLPGEPE